MENTSFYHFAPRKPRSPSLDILVEKLSPYVEFNQYPPGKRLPFERHGVRKCYLIRSGAITLHQQLDDILLGMFEAPSIRGVVHGNGEYSYSFLTLRVFTLSEIAILSYDAFIALIAKLELWQDLFNHLQAVTAALFTHNLQLTLPTSRQIVFNQLIELMHEPQRLRESMTAEKYIRSKTRLSRSGTMRIIAELRAEGHIVIHNGLLEAIKSYPARL